MEKVDVPAAPSRLIHAVASIGYDTEVALCDLIDNSIDAGAHSIAVALDEEVREEGETDTIHRYIISDDGCGMDRNGLVNAFTLGSKRAYAAHSLGKFGLGLKSAGLSLSNRMVIVTKAADAPEPICAILSVAEVEQSEKYQIDIGEPPEAYAAEWKKRSGSAKSGTVLILEELSESQPPYARFLEYFRRYCSVVYHMILAGPARPVALNVNDQALTPTDPLFLEEAKQNGPLSPQEWDGRSPRLLLEDQPLTLDEKAECTIAATQLVHPPSFEAEGKRPEIRDRYNIEADPYTRAPRHGFYIYRNRRIIVMAERFHGIVSAQTQAWAFRGRLMFDESADEILALDVKKRHCLLPKNARNNLSVRQEITSHSAAARGWMV